MTVSKEVKVGLLALVSGVMLYFGFNFLRGTDFLSSTKKYYAVYDDIDGLTASNLVLINGFQVGKVKTIQILQNQRNRLLVTFEVKRDILLNDATRAVLTDNGLLGGKVIDLTVGGGKRTLAGNDTLVATTAGGISALIQQKALPVMDKLDSLTASLNRTVDQFDSTGYILNQTLRNFRQTSLALNGLMGDNRGSLKGTLANFNRLSASLVETEKELKPLLGKMNTVADSLGQLKLSQAVDNANRSIANLNTLLADINAGKGTLGKLSKNDSLYTNVNKATADLDRLLVDFRRNPKRYVSFSLFGGKEKTAQEKKAPRIKKKKEVTKYQ